MRPGDANEVAWAWKTILERRDGPAGIALTRQNIPVFERGDGDASGDTLASASNVAKGAYVLAEAAGGTPDVILIATGSEVQLAVEAREPLAAEGINARVVSVPCLEWFEEQAAEYRESVLPAAVTARVSVEAGLALTWQPYVGDARSQRLDRALRRLRRLQDPVPRVRHHDRGRRRRRQGIARGRRLSARTEEAQAHDRQHHHHRTAALRRSASASGSTTSRASASPPAASQKLIDERNVVGVTTNPTIFADALAKGDAYDEQVAELAAAGTSRHRGRLRDHDRRRRRRRRDIFRPVYDATGGVDGRVSIEVEPGPRARHRGHHRRRPSSSGPRSTARTR